ncbi:hypothetical protein AVEN_203695-1 [Araneus ventricosus]|uniref:Uncharacterized protein n=1 Tax=Araneus ventricosus TaxID=182803 RepID=A0A4Y2F0L7_ARAVE|nr:hypothetical protein AVEN_203695-1 [Araneus ventricosus]
MNNAGVLETQEFPHLTSENLELHFRVNTVAPVMVFQRSAHKLPSSHCERSSKVVPNGSTTTYHSASNSLLVHTADRTPTTFALQADPSESTTYTAHPTPKDLPLYVLYGRVRSPKAVAATPMHTQRTFTGNRISALFLLSTATRCPSREVEHISEISESGGFTYTCHGMVDLLRLKGPF